MNADRASLFLVDHRNHELFARIFDVGSSSAMKSPQSDEKQEIRLAPFDQAGSAAIRELVLDYLPCWSLYSPVGPKCNSHRTIFG